MLFRYVGKILTALATPLGLAIAALVLAAFSLRKKPRSPPFILTLLATSVLLFCSSGCGSAFLISTLEAPYADQTLAAAPTAQAIVVLGGYIRVQRRSGRPVEIGGAADRLLCAAELYRASKAPFILLAGGNVTFFKASVAAPEAELASRILQEWGVPASAILTEDESQNTHENAVFSERILASHGIRRILLVTSGFHMRRASGSFRRAGLTVLPFAADFIAEGEPTDLLLSLLPDVGSTSDSGLALKEWLGIASYRARGWMD